MCPSAQEPKCPSVQEPKCPKAQEPKCPRARPWKDHFKSDLRSDQDHRLKNDLRSDQEDHLFWKSDLDLRSFKKIISKKLPLTFLTLKQTKRWLFYIFMLFICYFDKCLLAYTISCILKFVWAFVCCAFFEKSLVREALLKNKMILLIFKK
jgi:hypothetical protein